MTATRVIALRDAVRGLTTAASVWLAASIGAAAGAVTTAYLVVAFLFLPLSGRLPRSPSQAVMLRISYLDGRGLLRDIVRECTRAGFQVSGLRSTGPLPTGAAPTQVGVLLELSGQGEREILVSQLSDRDGITEVTLLEDTGDRRPLPCGSRARPDRPPVPVGFASQSASRPVGLRSAWK